MPRITPISGLCLRSFRVTGRVINKIHAVHLRGGVPGGRTLRLRMLNRRGSRFGTMVTGVYGLSSVVHARRGATNSTSFLIHAARCTIPLNGVVGIRRRLTGLRSRLGCRRNFLTSIVGGLDGRDFMDGTPTGIVRVRHGGRTSTRDGVGSVRRDVTTLGG